jgi:hypothetical protein
MDSASPETGKQMTRRSPAGNAGKVCHHARVEHRIDLDQVAALISGHAAAWAQAGLAVGPLTWRDVGVPWPYPLKTDREEVTDADSVGVVVRNQEQEGRLVIFRGGWADLEYWIGQHSDDPVAEAPGAHDPMHLSDIEQLLERFASLFP